MRFLLDLAWRDLRAGGRPLWVFAACLMLGVALIAAGGGLYRQVSASMQADLRTLFGGDLEVEHRAPLAPDVLDWMAQRGEVSRLVELRTMLRRQDGRAMLVELQSADARYPLYGKLELQPAGPLSETLAQRNGSWGIALDAVLARRLELAPGDRVEVGDAELEVRALVLEQPDRGLRAEWRGGPVLVSDGGLAATGLVQPLSRVEYQYRVRTDEAPAAWRSAFFDAFPELRAEVRTVDDRSDRVAEVLGQIGSGLLLVGFSALFIGGLGVFNSVRAYLDGKLGTLATLRALGLREGRLAALVLLQVLMLAAAASTLGALVGGALALAGLQIAAAQVPLAAPLSELLLPLLVAVGFGVLTAAAFALPALGRALSVSPAALFRGIDGGALRTPRAAWLLTAGVGLLVLAALVFALPDPRFGLAFFAAVALLLALLEGVLRGLRVLARRLLNSPGRRLGFEARVALSSLQRPGSPLRAALLSLGSALTLLVACTLVVSALLRAIDETVPREAPGLVFYDVQSSQVPLLREVMGAAPSLQRVETAPLVLGRLAAVNGEVLADSSVEGRRAEARDEQKLSHRSGNIDDVVVTRGAWWPAGDSSRPRVAMEDREADQMGLQVGDILRFEIMGQTVEAELAAIYAQRRMQARLWLEAIFSDGVLDPFITREVGAAWLSADDAIAAQDRLAAVAPNIVSVRTQALLDTTRGLMGRAGAGLAVIAFACLAASLLVLASVVAASRARQVYEASVMYALGARIGSLRRVLRWEYGLLAVVTALFAMLLGSLLAAVLLQWRLQLDPSGLYWTGAVTALGVSVLSLGAGAQVLLSRLKVSPAALLRAGG
ncbi:ABC transporter permease [Piscinibacter sakaiensis]|uniref:ABC transporter permease n=1 Tax=Piscinibacter sakaiensis TaxID=1547922 RepID=UPI003AAC43B6